MQGCVLLSRTEFSAPNVSRTNPEIKHEITLAKIMEKGKFSLEGANITVLPFNSRHFSFVGPVVPIIPFWGSLTAEAPLFVSVVFDPRTEELSFDPAQVVFKTAGGKEIYPAGFSGHSSPEPDCSGIQFPNPEEDSRKSKMACWSLMFNIIPPQPEERFVIYVGGIKKNGNPLPVYSLSYEKVSGWLLHIWPFGMTYFWQRNE